MTASPNPPYGTNNIVYKRLTPGIWEELKRLTPRNPGGDCKNKLFQR
jgi:hypothetical protein